MLMPGVRKRDHGHSFALSNLTQPNSACDFEVSLRKLRTESLGITEINTHVPKDLSKTVCNYCCLYTLSIDMVALTLQYNFCPVHSYNLIIISPCEACLTSSCRLRLWCIPIPPKSTDPFKMLDKI